jgi:predicted nucleotidyltransferase
MKCTDWINLVQARDISMPDQLEILQKKFRPIFKHFKTQKAIVFGSFARGEPSTRSDLDLILIQNIDKRNF